MEQEIKSHQNHKPMGNSMTRGEKTTEDRKGDLFNKQCWENWTDTHENEIRTFPNTTHKSKLNMF